MMQFFGNSPSCVVVMEACAGSHHVARQLAAMGHTAKLISPQFVKPFVKGNKNDFVDAEAICEAASRPSMRFVTPKTESQQTLSVLQLALKEGKDYVRQSAIKVLQQLGSEDSVPALDNLVFGDGGQILHLTGREPSEQGN